MKVYGMIPKDIHFLERPDLVKIKEVDGEELKTFSMTVQYYKKGKQFIVIDPKTGLAICRYIGNKKALRAYVESKMPDYIETLKENYEKIVRINRTYEKALENYKKIKEIQENSDFKPLKEFAKKGSGFQGGKQRIFDQFITIKDKENKIKFLKKEYGQGGFGFPRKDETQFELCSSWYDSKGILLEWYIPYQEDKEVGHYTYSQLSDEIDKLIAEKEYI